MERQFAQRVCSAFAVAAVALVAAACQREPAPVYAPITSLDFADPHLRDCVLQTAAEQGITEAGGLVILRCNGSRDSRISTLEGLGQLPSIERLNLAHNDLTQTGPINRLPRLREVDLSDNRIGNPDFHDLAGVRIISLDHNRLKSLDWLQNMRRLDSLSVSHNRIEDISGLMQTPSLRYLDLSHNSVSDIRPVSALVELHIADLSGNAIQDVGPLRPLKNLEALLLSYNPIGDLTPLTQLHELHELWLDGADISDISALRDMPALHRLSINHNRLSSIRSLLDLGQLTFVDVRNNSQLACGDEEALVERLGTDAVQGSACDLPETAAPQHGL